MENKLFLGFGIVTVLSGIYLAIQGDYWIGIPGSIVGIWLIVQNLKAIQKKG